MTTDIVDYKATSKAGEVTLDADWQIAYKRQMEFYQWLLRHSRIPLLAMPPFLIFAFYCRCDTGGNVDEAR